MRRINFTLLLSTACLITTSIFSQSLITVTDCNLNGWVKNPAGQATVTFVDGPLNAPLGNGSLQLASPNKTFGRLRNTQYSGTLLSTISELSYSTYVEQRDSTVDDIFVVLLIDINGDNKADHNLVFDPRYQTNPFITGTMPDQGITLEDTWQTWDALHGGWFFGGPITDDPDHNGPFFTLTTYLGQYPNATIRNDAAKGGGAIRVSIGGPVVSNNFIGNADNFKIGVNGATTTYNFEKSIANAGADKTVVYGYGSNCTTLNATGAGGFAPYSYAWSGGGISLNTQNVQVCPTINTTYTITVTDVNGCTGTDQVMVYVNDVRCGNKNDKVLVCHKGESICIAKSAVQSHLDHGDYLGACTSFPIQLSTTKAIEPVITNPIQFQLSNYPNPARDVTTIQYELPMDCSVLIRIYDLQGRPIATPLLENKKAGLHQVKFNSGNLKPGIYYYRITATSPTQSLSKTNKMIVIHL